VVALHIGCESDNMSKENDVVVTQPESRAESESEDVFEFDMWATQVGLSRKTTLVLRQEELCILEVKDAKEFGFPLGQQKLLMAAVAALQLPSIPAMPAANKEDTRSENAHSRQDGGTAADELTLPGLRNQVQIYH
jgi:hypothetical protein